MKILWVAGLAVLALTACSQRMVYQTLQGWQEQECRRLADTAERQRCLDSRASSYDEYRRQRDAAPSPR